MYLSGCLRSVSNLGLVQDLEKALGHIHQVNREDARRRRLFAFTIEDRMMRLWYADHSAIAVSRVFDFFSVSSITALVPITVETHAVLFYRNLNISFGLLSAFCTHPTRTSALISLSRPTGTGRRARGLSMSLLSIPEPMQTMSGSTRLSSCCRVSARKQSAGVALEYGR